MLLCSSFLYLLKTGQSSLTAQANSVLFELNLKGSKLTFYVTYSQVPPMSEVKKAQENFFFFLRNLFFEDSKANRPSFRK